MQNCSLNSQYPKKEKEKRGKNPLYEDYSVHKKDNIIKNDRKKVTGLVKWRRLASKIQEYYVHYI